MDLAAVDWLLSVEPHYTSSALGVQIIVAQLIVALDVAILALDDEGWVDLGSLFLATHVDDAVQARLDRGREF